MCPECLVVIDAWIIEENGKMSCSRYWIERPLEDAKGEGGLADYELRGYIGWNHHMGMVFMAMLFLVEMQDEWKWKALLLTLTDVREIFEVKDRSKKKCVQRTPEPTIFIFV